jgi:hypothetical protein
LDRNTGNIMKITKKKYLKSNKAVQMQMLWHILTRIELLILFGIALLAYIKWG